MRRIGLPLIAVLASLVAAAPAAAAITFSSKTVNTGNTPQGIVSDFFHGGGNEDLLTANSGDSNVNLLLGDGGGNFANASGSPFALPTGARAVATADFNADGNTDEVAAGVNDIAVRLGNGSGGLSAPTTVSVAGKTFSSVVTGDFNSDGLQDFAASTTGGAAEQVNVFLGNGSGTTFTPAAATVPIGGGQTRMDVGDFNNDGKPDLAVTSSGATTLQVFLGTGVGGGFVAQTAVNLGGATSPQFVAIGDVNNDGRADAAVTNSVGGGAGVFVLIGNGSGGFTNSASPASFNAGASPSGIAIDDVDFDSNGDLVVANASSPGGVTVLLNNGNGLSYASNGTTAAGNGTFDVTTGDFNNDGNVDIAATNSSSSNVTVLLQQPPTASVNPTSLNFNNVTVNTTSSTQSVTLTNNGGATIGPLARITGSQAGDFHLANDRCSPSTVFLGPGGTCSIGVDVRGGTLGNKSATLEISSNASNSPQRVSLNTTIVPNVPVTQAAPAISGTPVVGSQLSCSNGTWTNSPTGFSHQWLRNGNAIPGAGAATYVVTQADVAQQVSCRVTASNAGGNSQARTSNAVVPTGNTPALSVTVRKQTIQSVVSKGLTFNAGCTNACLISAQVTGPVPPKKKKRTSSRKPRRGKAARTAIVGRTTASVAGGTQKLTIKLSRAGRSALSKKSSARLSLSVTATDPSGSPSTTRTTGVSLKKATTKRRTSKRKPKK
jgi:hypothetical protein